MAKEARAVRAVEKAMASTAEVEKAEEDLTVGVAAMKVAAVKAVVVKVVAVREAARRQAAPQPRCLSEQQLAELPQRLPMRSRWQYFPARSASSSADVRSQLPQHSSGSQ